MWCRPDARLRHYYSCSFLSRSHSDPRLAPSILFLVIITHMRASWIFCLSRDRHYDHRIFSEHVFPQYIIPVFLMFASTFKRTHWLVPGYCLGQISCAEKSVSTTAPEPTQCWQQPREDRSYPGQLFLWEMESPRRRWTTNRFRHQPLETVCCTHRPQWSCTTY